MTNFKIDVSLLNEDIAVYKECKNNCLVDLGVIYNSLKNTDTGWKDNNTTTFLNILKRDKYKIDEYFRKLDLLYKQLETMRNGFENLLAKYGYNKKATLSYNDEYYQSCISSLNNVIGYLNRALSYANCCRFKKDYISRAEVYALKNEIKRMRTNARNLVGRINGFRTRINRILGTASSGISKIGEIDLKLAPFLYNWNLVDSTIVKKEIKEERIDSINQQNIVTDSEVLSTESYLKNAELVDNVAGNIVDKTRVGDDNEYNVAKNVTFHGANVSDVRTDSEVLSTESYLKNAELVDNVAGNVVDRSRVGDDNEYNVSDGLNFYNNEIINGSKKSK